VESQIGVFIASLVGLLIALGIMNLIGKGVDKTKKVYKENKPAVKKSLSSLRDLTKSEQQKIIDIDDRFFAIAKNELESGKQQEGLWVKCELMAEGNEMKAKSLYIKHRAKQLDENK